MLNLFTRFPAAAVVVLAMTLALAQGCSVSRPVVSQDPGAANTTTFNAVAGVR